MINMKKSINKQLWYSLLILMGIFLTDRIVMFMYILSKAIREFTNPIILVVLIIPLITLCALVYSIVEIYREKKMGYLVSCILSLWILSESWQYLSKNKLAMAPLGYIECIVLIAIFIISGYFYYNIFKITVKK